MEDVKVRRESGVSHSWFEEMIVHPVENLQSLYMFSRLTFWGRNYFFFNFSTPCI